MTNAPFTTHAARMLFNRQPEARDWAEEFLKQREHETFTAANPAATAEEFEKHWRYCRPERLHEHAVEAATAYRAAHAKS